MPLVEEDIGAVQGARPWYTCFTNGVYQILVPSKRACPACFQACPLLLPFFRTAEALLLRPPKECRGQAVRLLPPAFSDWFEHVLVCAL